MCSETSLKKKAESLPLPVSPHKHKSYNMLPITVTTLAFPNSLKSLPIPLCLSTLLPFYSQVTAVAPTQSLYYRIKEQLENKLYSSPYVLHSAPTAHDSPREVPEQIACKHGHQSQHKVLSWL